jgi:hypothetical protein
MVFLPQGSPPQPCMHLSFTPYVLRASPITFLHLNTQRHYDSDSARTVYSSNETANTQVPSIATARASITLTLSAQSRNYRSWQNDLRTSKRYVMLTDYYDNRCPSGRDGHMYRRQVHHHLLTHSHEWQFTSLFPAALTDNSSSDNSLHCFLQHLLTVPTVTIHFTVSCSTYWQFQQWQNGQSTK